MCALSSMEEIDSFLSPPGMEHGQLVPVRKVVPAAAWKRWKWVVSAMIPACTGKGQYSESGLSNPMNAICVSKSDIVLLKAAK